MLPLETSVGLRAIVGAPVDAPSPAFPTPELVAAAAGLFSRETVPERVGGYGPSTELAISLGHLDDRARLVAAGRRELVEGVRWRVEVAPGVVAVRSYDPARSERSAERALHARQIEVQQMAARMLAGEDEPEHEPARSVSVWSARSRSRMVQRLAELDHGPMFAQCGRAGMVTLTYPGAWLVVAPDSATCHRHLLAFRKRFERQFARPLLAVWKREFQRRGAPHYHLMMMCPTEVPGGESFREWVARVWSEIVDHPDPVERERGRQAGTAVDYTEGSRCLDPRRLAVYFSKHGSYAAKEYQNEAPAEWSGSVGRFWGYWHLRPAVAAVEVAPDVARAVVRTARRYSRANRYYVARPVWRKVTTVDRETGEIGFRWRRRSSKVPVRRLRGSAGYLVVNDGAAFAASLARASELIVRPRAGSGPVGFLP